MRKVPDRGCLATRCVIVFFYMFAMMPLCHALVRSGPFLSVGSATLRVMPSEFQSGDFESLTDGMLSIYAENYMTMLGFERMTLASSVDAVWFSAFDLTEWNRFALKNDLYYQINSQISMGVATERTWVDQHCCQTMGALDGFQYGLSLRWRW